MNSTIFRSAILKTLLVCLWLAAHVASLTRYPPMHADEAWLASETRAIVEARSAAAPADFFRITFRPVHAIRLLFHFLQAPFAAADWSLSSVRLLSLACSLAVAGMAAALARGFRLSGARLLLTAGLALDPQIFVSSHLARPEIVLAAVMMGALLLRDRRPLPGLWTEALVGAVLGLSVGVHANSLPVVLGVGALYVLDLAAASDRRRALLRLLVVVGVTALGAALWAGWSRLLCPDFPRHYVDFGLRYGVGESLAVKLLRLPGFYARLFDRVAGTYYVPEWRPSLVVLAVSAAAALALLSVRAARAASGARPRAGAPSAVRLLEPLLLLAGVNAGLVAIGKYSQPVAVLLTPGIWWLAASVLEAVCAQADGQESSPRRVRAAALHAATALAAGLGMATARGAAPWMGVSYERYIARIENHVEAGAPVLGGLNTAFAFGPGELHAFNDLAGLGAAGLSLSQYIERHGIRYILFPTELERIYAERPTWNDLYGNPAPYYADLRRFLTERCEVVAEYDEPVFAMRILAYQAGSAARLTIYRVLPPH